jgi:hypothetical protein
MTTLGLIKAFVRGFTVLAKRLLDKLTGGDRRSIGRADEVAKLVLKQPAFFRELMTGIRDADPLVCMRAADAAEKVSRKRPELLHPFQAELLRLLDEASQQELRWHLAQMVPRLPLTQKQRVRAASALRRYLEDPSSIVKTCALQALAEIAARDASLQPEVKTLLQKAVRTGTPAMKARSRKLLRQFEARSRGLCC